jgi:hypothetical protein
VEREFTNLLLICICAIVVGLAAGVILSTAPPPAPPNPFATQVGFAEHRPGNNTHCRHALRGWPPACTPGGSSLHQLSLRLTSDELTVLYSNGQTTDPSSWP